MHGVGYTQHRVRVYTHSILVQMCDEDVVGACSAAAATAKLPQTNKPTTYTHINACMFVLHRCTVCMHVCVKWKEK